MTSLGTVSHVAGSVPGKEGLAQAGTWRDYRNASSGNRFAAIDSAHVTWPQDRNCTGNRLQIVDEVDRVDIKVQLLRERVLVNDPGQVRCLHPAIDHRPGHSKARPIDWHLCFGLELLGHNP